MNTVVDELISDLEFEFQSIESCYYHDTGGLHDTKLEKPKHWKGSKQLNKPSIQELLDMIAEGDLCKGKKT